MTVVFSYVHKGRPFVVGDILLSALPGSNLSPAWVPTIGLTSKLGPTKTGFEIAGLRQKVSLISDSCVVAWSGSENAARELIVALRERAAIAVISMDDIVRIAQSLDATKQILSKVTLVGALFDEVDGGIFSIPPQHIDSNAFGPMALAGTGYDALSRLLERQISFRAREAKNEYIETLAGAFQIIANLLHVETTSGETLRNNFGGAYEIATAIGGRRFQKLDDVTFVLWRAYEVEDGEIRIAGPLNVVNVNYDGDVMLVCGMTIVSGDRGIEGLHLDRQAVMPIYRDPTTLELRQFAKLPNPDFNAMYICHSFRFDLLDGRSGVISDFERDDQRRGSSIQFFDGGSQGEDELINVRLNSAFIERIKTQVREARDDPFP